MTSQRTRRTPVTTINSEQDIRRGVRVLTRKCPVLRRIYKSTGTPPLRRRAPGFGGLLRIIIGQQVSVASADAIWARCVDNIHPMSAVTVQGLSDDDLKRCGLSRPKIRTVRALSKAVLEDGLDLDGAAAQVHDTFRDQLLAVSGIGPWTADVFQLFCIGLPDAFAPGDLAMQIAAQDAFELDERPGADKLAQLAEAWRPWRGIAARLLWAHYAVLKQGRSGVVG